MNPVQRIVNIIQSADAVPAPNNTDAPSIDDLTPVIPQMLTGSDGTWLNATSFTRQWYRNGVAIGSATNATYTTVDADFGATLTYGVTATGPGGVSTEAASAATGAVNTAGNMVLTPFFLTDTNWTKGTNWTISGGKANAAAAPSGGTGNLTQNISLVADTSYSIRFTISDYSAGTIRILCGNVTPGTSRSSNGTFTQTLVRNAAGDGVLYFQVTAEFTGKIDNVSVVPN
jgi:hypothetical protein